MISKIKENIGLIFILMIPFTLLLYWNIKTSNIGFIYFHNLDYWYHYKIAAGMFEGLINLNPADFYNKIPFSTSAENLGLSLFSIINRVYQINEK